MIKDIYYNLKYKLLDLKDSVFGIYYDTLYKIEDAKDSLNSKIKKLKRKKSKSRSKKAK